MLAPGFVPRGNKKKVKENRMVESRYLTKRRCRRYKHMDHRLGFEKRPRSKSDRCRYWSNNCCYWLRSIATPPWRCVRTAKRLR